MRRSTLCTSGGSPNCGDFWQLTDQASTTSWQDYLSRRSGTSVCCCTASVLGVGQAPGGPLRFAPESPAPLLVFSDQSPIASGLRCPVPALDRAYPPIPLLEKTLIERRDQAEVIIIAPSWPYRFWDHLLLQMACEILFQLPCLQDLLSQHLPNKGMLYHTDLETLQLTVWKLSGVPPDQRVFRCSYRNDPSCHP